MTVRTPTWLQAGSYPAETDRLLLQTLLGGSPNQTPRVGVVGGSDFVVTASPTPDMNVHVASGSCFISGTETTTQGVYGFYSDAAVTVPIAASTSQPRISLIVAQVLDAGYSGASNIGQIVEVAGVPASSPVAPATPKNSIVLAQVAVAASAASITSGNITDSRPFMVGARPRTIFGGPPTSGQWTAGDRVTDTKYGLEWVCTASGTPGTWSNIGSGLVRSRMYRLAALNLTGGLGDTLFPFDTVDTVYGDPLAIATVGASAHFTVPVAGFYRVSFGIQTSNIGAGPGRLAGTVVKNGVSSAVVSDVTGSVTTNPGFAGGTASVRCAAGDQITLTYNSTNAVAVFNNTQSCWAQIEIA